MSPIIGSNLRKGMRPGGFTSHIYASTSGRMPSPKKVTDEAVRAAAKAALDRRGLNLAPTLFSDARHESLFSK